MNDYLVRIIAREAGVRAMASATTNLVVEGCNRHGTGGVATVALGRALTSGGFMGMLLKNGQRVACKFTGDGPLEKIIVEADSYGRVRGYVSNPVVRTIDSLIDDALSEEKMDIVTHALGTNGQLTVTKDLLNQGLSEGVVPIQYGDINSDLVFYMQQSEQNPTLIESDVLLDDDNGEVRVAGGVVIQALPGHEDDDTLAKFEERLDKFPSVVEMLHDGKLPEDVLADLFTDIEYTVLEHCDLIFRCTCSVERIESALRMLDERDLNELIEEGQAEIDCHFCHEEYTFDREALEKLRR